MPVAKQYTLLAPTGPDAIPLFRFTTKMCFIVWGVPPTAAVLDAALLIVTELAVNCVRHAAERSPKSELSLALKGGNLQMAVADSHPWVPAVPAHGGLHVIADLVRVFDGRLTITPNPDGRGKTIRVALPAPGP
ncbi:ATP-binding protein [Kitasatospora indigofera]|uniref:ATP-binding protein n=1 Tax=Kitasatospora indigofera TaxID=67307 RepID=UPI0036C31EE1